MLRLSPEDGLANRCLRPLGQLSIICHCCIVLLWITITLLSFAFIVSTYIEAVATACSTFITEVTGMTHNLLTSTRNGRFEPEPSVRVHYPGVHRVFPKQYNNGVPSGIRTRVPNVKGWYPRPLDDRDNICLTFLKNNVNFLTCIYYIAELSLSQ